MYNTILIARKSITTSQLNTNARLRTSQRCIHSSNRLRNSTPTPIPPPTISHLKHPTRGGQNLSDRYKRLERSVRGKETYVRLLEENVAIENAVKAGSGGMVKDFAKGGGKEPMVFKGFVVPEEPKEPEPDECCMSGCAICVHDLYNDSLQEYNEAMATLRGSLLKAGVKEEEWPDRIRGKWGSGVQTVQDKGKQPNPVMSAFEAMERQLEEKRRERERASDEPTTESDKVMDNPPKPAKKSKTKKSPLADAGAVVEALSWVVFSKR